MTLPSTSDLALAPFFLSDIPRERDPHSRYREYMAVDATKTERALILRACGERSADGFLLWCNTFAWTFNPRLHPGYVPFLLWPVQERAARDLFNGIDLGHDVLFDKSRDMGASWLCLAMAAWWWLFVPDTPILIASRKEEYVDGRGNPDTLFWKLDYLLAACPPWMRPRRVERRFKHLGNPAGGSVIDGEATNPDLGRGGRRKFVLLDEFAAVENGGEILTATADATPCRVFNSTPHGRANAFADVRFSGKVQVVTLHWREHPDKGRGAKQVADAAGKLHWTSPWYEAECARRTSRKEIAQELDIDYLASGDTFFDLDVCQRIRASGQLTPPRLVGDLEYTIDTRAPGQSYRLSPPVWRPDGGRRLVKLWCPLIDGRPAQDANYVAFADISAGQGASNSALFVANANTREIVASCVTSDLMPQDFADLAVAVCRWFAGKLPVYLGWEANGPGAQFGKRCCQLGYWFVLGNENTLAAFQPEDNKVGWWSSRDKKSLLLGDLRAALAKGELTVHDEATIAESEQYIYYASGAIGPSGLVDDGEGARAAHGDRVIATAGLLLCLSNQPKAKAPEPPIASGSYLDRRRQYEQEQRSNETW